MAFCTAGEIVCFVWNILCSGTGFGVVVVALVVLVEMVVTLGEAVALFAVVIACLCVISIDGWVRANKRSINYDYTSSVFLVCVV